MSEPEVHIGRLYLWLKEQEGKAMRLERDSPNPLIRYKERGAREAYAAVVKHLDYVRGAR